MISINWAFEAIMPGFCEIKQQISVFGMYFEENTVLSLARKVATPEIVQKNIETGTSALYSLVLKFMTGQGKNLTDWWCLEDSIQYKGRYLKHPKYGMIFYCPVRRIVGLIKGSGIYTSIYDCSPKLQTEIFDLLNAEVQKELWYV